MKFRSTGGFLAAGVILVGAVNAFVLLGVAYNRKPPAESEMVLSERELPPAYVGSWSEDSGMNLRLNIRNETGWLTPEKLRSLGFALSVNEQSDADRLHDDKLLPRDAYLVLELSGDARSSQKAADELNNPSRLQCVDAGLDPVALRNAHPDRSTFAIVLGTVRTSIIRNEGQWHVVGRVTGVRTQLINVPLVYRSVFGDGRQLSRAFALSVSPRTATPRYNVSVAWGRRFEPWIVSASKPPEQQSDEAAR